MIFERPASEDRSRLKAQSVEVNSDVTAVPGLDPGIRPGHPRGAAAHYFRLYGSRLGVDTRHKAGHDGNHARRFSQEPTAVERRRLTTLIWLMRGVPSSRRAAITETWRYELSGPPEGEASPVVRRRHIADARQRRENGGDLVRDFSALFEGFGDRVGVERILGEASAAMTAAVCMTSSDGKEGFGPAFRKSTDRRRGGMFKTSHNSRRNIA